MNRNQVLPHRRRSWWRRRITCTAFALIVLSACSSSGDDSADSSAVQPTPALASTSTISAPNSTVAVRTSIDDEFLAEQAAKSWDPTRPGAVMVVVYDTAGGLVHSSVGTDDGGATPVPGDAVRVGSISKTFAAITVLSLVDEGLIGLDDPISEHVSRVEVDEAVTVRDALQHSSGLPEYTDVSGFLDMLVADPERVWEPEEAFELPPQGELDFEPGTAFRYSSTNFIVLGILVEEVTGQQYHEVLRDRVTGPLGMTDTYLDWYEEGADVFGGYYGLSGSVEPVDFDYTSIATIAWSAGAVVSTGHDLHTMLSALFAGEIISSALVDEMTADPENGMGIWAPEWTSETPLLGHDGRMPGSGTLVIHAPETGLTVFTFSNADHLKVSPATGDVAELIGIPGVNLD